MEEKNEEVAAVRPSESLAAAAEPAKVRPGNRAFKVAAIVFSVLFALLLAAAFFIYQKFSGFGEFLMPPSGVSRDSAFRAGEAVPPGTLPEGFKRSEALTQPQGGSALTVFTNAGEYLQAAAAVTAEDGEKAARAFAKYADRAIVKDFMTELEKDPDFARALKEKKANNPLAMIASVQKAKSMRGLTLKFVTRKDFMPLLMEVMNDPDLKPLLGRLPMGNIGPGAQMLKQLSGAAPSPAPVIASPENNAVADMAPGEPALLDSSAMQSPAPSSEAGLQKKAPPLPGN